MDYDTHSTPALRTRYRVLAGPFTTQEAPLLTGLRAYLAATGARTTIVGCETGVEVWRLRSEMEGLADTARRLRRR